MDKKQFKKNKKWINKKINKKFPGVKVFWDSNDIPAIEMPESQLEYQSAIIEEVHTLIERCGGEAVFYPEKAYIKETIPGKPKFEFPK